MLSDSQCVAALLVFNCAILVDAFHCAHDLGVFHCAILRVVGLFHCTHEQCDFHCPVVLSVFYCAPVVGAPFCSCSGRLLCVAVV